MQHSDALAQLHQAISKVHELKPLLPALQRHTPKSENEDHLSFASLFNAIRRLPEFEEQYQKDVPDVIKGLIQAYAEATPHDPTPITDRNVLANMASASPLPHSHVLHSPDVISEVSKLTSLYTGVEPQPQGPQAEPLPLPSDPLPPPSIPIPPSSMFHSFMSLILEKVQPHPQVMEGDGKEMQWVSKLEFQNHSEKIGL